MKKTIRYTLISITGILVFLLLYIGFAFLFSAITSGNVAKDQPITIYVKSNGVHTDIVLPVQHPIIKWDSVFSFTHTKSGDTLARYVAIGWGDKGFYLNTPTWADLTFSTAFKAVTGLGSTALHVTYYQTIQEGALCKRFTVNEQNYQHLTNYILQSLQLNEQGKAIWIKTDAVYGETDAFYEARGHYSLLHTCNTWTNNALKSCRQRACIWTPFDKGVLDACSDE